MTRILGISGSLRQHSFNTTLLRHAATQAPCGVELVEWGGLVAIPPFSEDTEDAPGVAVVGLREAIAESHAVLLATPEYNGSLPGQLKNALDWASRPFPDNVLRGKPVAVIGTSPSPGGTARAQTDARKILAAIGAQVLDIGLQLPRAPEHLNRSATDDTDKSSGSLDADLRHALTAVLRELAAATG